MSIKQVVVDIAKYIARLTLERFSGTLTFEINMRGGGIGSVHVHIDHTLKKDNKIDDKILNEVLNGD